MATTSTVAAVVAANSQRVHTPSGFPYKPTPLNLDDSDDGDRNSVYLDARARRSSMGSMTSDDEETPLSSGISGLDSSAALILVHDDDEDQDNHFDFSDDEMEHDDIVSPVFEIRRTSIPSLRPLYIFLYLLSPYVKLGALNILTSAENISLKYTLPALFGFAIASVFSRQLWYMLARYVRKADVMEVVCDTFAKGRGKDRMRRYIRRTVKVATGFSNTLLAVVYLHESVHYLLPLLPDSILSRIGIGAVFSSIIVYLSTAQTLAVKRVVVASWLSLLAYLAWFGAVIYGHAKGLLPRQGGWFSHPPSFWQGIFTIAFTFTTSSTLPLYASLKSGTNPVSTTKTPRSQSFRVLSYLSTSCATALILPLVIFAALPNAPESVIPPTSSEDVLSLPNSPSPEDSVRIALACLASATLLLGVPQAILSVPSLPLRIGRTPTVSRTITSLSIIILAVLLSFLHTSFLEHLFTPLNITLIILGISSTYFFPALLHIAIHFFRRPLAIVIPRTPLVQTPSMSHSNLQSPTPQGPPRAVHDELLQRKERALQKKQNKKRIVWDIGACVMVAFCVAGAVVGLSLLRS